MKDQSETPPEKHICIGILAHVDSGKTSLTEGLLYLAGSIRKLGRVDHGNSFLDTEALERERGITIFSKQALLSWKNLNLTILDTPGHVDFSAEMERTLQVLDYAVLVISGSDGIQSHTETLWRLLQRHGIPVFLFINKMDQAGADRAEVLARLQSRLSDACIDFGQPEDALLEQAALCDEDLMEQYLGGTAPSDRDLGSLIVRRKLFPCYFGSALKLDGVEELMDGLARYTLEPDWPDPFGARIFKISRDEHGDRLTWLRVTGGTLRVRSVLSGGTGDHSWEEKVSQIRIYSGLRFTSAEEVPAGTVCAVTGLSQTRPGMTLGAESLPEVPLLEPVLHYQVLPPEGCDLHVLLQDLRQLEEEDPQLQVLWNDSLGEIHLRLMGEIQVEVLTRLISERFGISVSFGPGSILYKETIAAPIEGVGHFEPLRHYAEVHLLLEPLERGAGLQYDSICPEDVLDRNWQRLILTHLEEKVHAGVLTGSPITDMKLILLTGRAHPKHTEGGDFRQATYRAVRQGLRSAESILLEPWYDFRLEVPPDCVGRAMTDLQRMGAHFEQGTAEEGRSVLEGTAPVSELNPYRAQISAFTRGRGQLNCTLRGYEPCHNSEEVLSRIGYDPDQDPENPSDSIFCSHGSGFQVKWNEVRSHMQVDSGWRPQQEPSGESPASAVPRTVSYEDSVRMEKELEAIFIRTYGPIKPRAFAPVPKEPPRREKAWKGLSSRPPEEEYLLVDGYNIIHAWEDLDDLAREDLDGARIRLLDLLCNYQGWRNCHVIVVFDAYRVKGNPGSVEQYRNIHVVYTREAETADTYIEKTTYEIAPHYRVRVATSDRLEQMIILGHGADRISARELKLELELAEEQIRSILES